MDWVVWIRQWMDGWIFVCISGWTVGWMDAMNAWSDLRMLTWMDGWMMNTPMDLVRYEWMTRRMDWFMDTEMDGWSDSRRHKQLRGRMSGRDGARRAHSRSRAASTKKDCAVIQLRLRPRRSSPATHKFPAASSPRTSTQLPLHQISSAPQDRAGHLFMCRFVSDCCFAITHCQGRPRRYTSFATLIWIMYHSSVQGCGSRARVVSQFRTRGLAWKNANGHISAAVSWQRFILR